MDAVPRLIYRQDAKSPRRAPRAGLALALILATWRLGGFHRKRPSLKSGHGSLPTPPRGRPPRDRVLLRDLGPPAPRARRGPLRRDRARDGRGRRLGHAASQRHPLLREAAALLLARGRVDPGARAERARGPPAERD